MFSRVTISSYMSALISECGPIILPARNCSRGELADIYDNPPPHGTPLGYGTLTQRKPLLRAWNVWRTTRILSGNVFIKILVSLWTFEMLLKGMFHKSKEFQTISKNSNGYFEAPLPPSTILWKFKKKRTHIYRT